MPLDAAPITITLYDAQDEVKATYTRSKIPWGILKKAIRLSQTIGDAADVREEQVDAIGGLVVEVFGDQFTIEDLDAGADVQEMMAVLRAIIARASALVQANPTPPAPKKK